MDQIFQLQRQIQDLRQEVNNISQVASQLQHSEANNAAQLQRLQQNESIATQQLQAIQQVCNRMGQDVNAISNVTQQVTAQMANRPLTSGHFGTGMNQWGTTGQYGTPGTGISTGIYGPTQFGTFGSQFGNRGESEFQRNQYLSQMAANRYGIGFNTPDLYTNQYLSGMANQGVLGSQSNWTGGYGAGSFGSGLGQTGFAGTSTGNFTVSPAHPAQTSQYGAHGFAGSQYTPTYSAGQWGTSNQMGSGLLGNQPSFSMGTQNVGRYSNF